MRFVDVHTQAELEEALKTKGVVPVCRGDGYFKASGSATVEASGSATVEASGSASVRAYGSATVEASGSASVRAYGSATVRAYGTASVRAYGTATVRAYGTASVRAGKYVAVHKMPGSRGEITGGVVIDVPAPQTASEWCAYHDLEVVNGVVVLFKAVADDFGTDNSRARGIVYTPGTTVEAPDWDGGRAECGGGLHFSTRPWIAKLHFNSSATRFVACPVRVEDISLHPVSYGAATKVKARAVCAPIVEVDEDGEPVAVAGEKEPAA